ncbi:MAG: helicase-related protein [Candidatus Omnitrophota bacterium]
MSSITQVRTDIVDFLRKELIGPDPRQEFAAFNNGDEILRPQDPPRLRYSAGVLFPGSANVEQAEVATSEEVEAAENGPPDGEEPEDLAEGNGSAGTDVSTEHEVNRANQFLPSAMGLTALVRLPRALKVIVKCAYYEGKTQESVGKCKTDGQWRKHYWRKAANLGPVLIECDSLRPSATIIKRFPIVIGDGGSLKAELHVYSRPYAHAQDPSKDRIVTFTLINRTSITGKGPKDSECLFQCEFSVESLDGDNIFLEYPERDVLESDEEEQSLRLLYRHRKIFAVGHGTAAGWPETESASVARVNTDSLPAYEIKPIIPNELSGLDLSMKQLSNNLDPAIIEKCKSLGEAYKAWIDAQYSVVNAQDFPSDYRVIAHKHLDRCKECHQRIMRGVDLLRADEEVRRAFAWMNRAMLLQQLHYGLCTDHRRGWVNKAGVLSLEAPFNPPDEENPPQGKGKWRPFQLAFILMNLHSISNCEDPERSIVDLIWFPTGGGKTEAYLGLTAFTIFRRRLVNPRDIGTTVLMRYTLRLLTTQQFQRAASLICACEVIRRENERQIGFDRISIGLWVGGDVTPNKNADAVKSLNTLRANGKPNPFIVLTCPWCGAEMGPQPFGSGAYQVKGYRTEGAKVIFRCEDSQCKFSDARGLPLYVVDEAIYSERPTLLIGTVDKFAMLPWQPEARKIFGLDDGAPVPPPDLIIQDELHLISGALGSMVGIYEGTIDALCRKTLKSGRWPAKIIASTATICRASQQVNSLYSREVFIFPPQALRAGDSFFAKEATQDVLGRLYVGVFGSALSSHVTAQIRVMSALLQSVKCVQSSPEGLNPYWTLMSYFNSLRELGHAATLIRADIREYLNAVWDRLDIRKPAQGSGAPDLRRFINRDLELTSRIQSSEINSVLQQLFNGYPGTDDRRPVDVCLATNMIQVGLDVPRLGLMTVVGQPKMTSEYIQATSRVGRDKSGPGLVVVVYNCAKPRDRSHFEHFRSYHQSIYRWVEPTSVTPFATPVRERALHAQLITLARYWGDSVLRTDSRKPPDSALTKMIEDVLISRIKQVDQVEVVAAEKMIKDFWARWNNIQPPHYGGFGVPPAGTPLMYPGGSEPRIDWANRSKATPTSMRNVDSVCDAQVVAQFLKEKD